MSHFQLESLIRVGDASSRRHELEKTDEAFSVYIPRVSTVLPMRRRQSFKNPLLRAVGQTHRNSASKQNSSAVLELKFVHRILLYGYGLPAGNTYRLQWTSGLLTTSRLFSQLYLMSLKERQSSRKNGEFSERADVFKFSSVDRGS